MAVPIIGIQASIVQVGDVRGLHFTKVIDSYEEPEEEEAARQAYDEKHWIDNYPGTLEARMNPPLRKADVLWPQRDRRVEAQ